jgi:hypothetical protein
VYLWQVIKGFDRAFINVGIRFDLTRVYGPKQIVFPLVLLTCLLDSTVFKPTAKGEVKSA